jgi:hypothetical protein
MLMSTWTINTDDSKTALERHNAVRIRRGSNLARFGLAPGGRCLAPGTVLTARFVRAPRTALAVRSIHP